MYRKKYLFLVLILTIYRSIMKFIFIDFDSGFYNCAPFFSFIENILFITALVLCLLSKNISEIEFKETKSLRLYATITGLFFSTSVVIKFLKTIKIEQFSVNSIPKPLLYVELLVGIISSLYMLTKAIYPFDVRFSLLIPLWHSIYAIDRFISFKQVTTVSDQLLETLFLIFATVFWSQFTEYLGGSKQNNKITLIFGTASLVIGIPLAISQLLSLFFFQQVSGPNFIAVIVILGDCVYINQFIKELNYSQKKL